MKIIDDTLKFKGKWSRKSLTTFVSFIMSILIGWYIALSKIHNPSAELVFLGFLGLSGGALGLTVIDKIKNGKTEP